MRLFLAFLLSPPLYALGHIASTVAHIPGFHWLWHPYQWCMGASSDLEDWAGVEVMWYSRD